jgi:hypothetical protein
MSEATVESAFSEPENQVSSESETTPARPGNEIILASRHVIQPDVILPHLNTHSAKAYAAIDTEDFSNALYALVLDQTIPARLPAIVNSKNLVHDALIRPVRWGRVAWGNTGREEIVIVLPPPSGPPLFPSMEATVQPWLVREIKRDFLTPILDLLKRMHDERVSHRNLRPTNLFRKQDDGTVQSGQIYSAPPGFELVMNRHARLDTEIYRIKTDAKSARQQANRLGQEFAANIASVFGPLVLGALVVMQLS